MSRTGEAQLHGRKKAVAAGDDLGVVTEFLQERDRFGNRAGPVIIERIRVHASGPPGLGLDRLERAAGSHFLCREPN